MAKRRNSPISRGTS